jgi:hypothetical protein
MELQEFIQAANTFSSIGFEVTVIPHSRIDNEYNLTIHIKPGLYFSYSLVTGGLFLEDEEGIVFIGNFYPKEAVHFILNFVRPL